MKQTILSVYHLLKVCPKYIHLHPCSSYIQDTLLAQTRKNAQLAFKRLNSTKCKEVKAMKPTFCSAVHFCFCWLLTCCGWRYFLPNTLKKNSYSPLKSAGSIKNQTTTKKLMEMQNIGIEKSEKKQRQIELYRDLFVGYLLVFCFSLNNDTRAIVT